MSGTTPRCHECGGFLQEREIGYVCYGCRIKSRCSIAEHGCWIWQGAKRGNYGVIRVFFQNRYRIRNVHRVAYVVWRGPVENSWSVLHLPTCREKLCCRPDHLYVAQQPIEIGHAPMGLRFD